LKRVWDATNAGDGIRAVIRGSAVNQDGRSNGLTAPNGPAQQAVIREALRDAGVEAREISYVEAHGTGTPLGDPIEMQSILAALGEGRGADDACWVGSVKTSIGHLESAAGIASLIKTVLALEHQEIPPHLHYRQANPHIVLEQTPFQVASFLREWKANGARRLAGVSSFGFGGTNAHVILEEAPVAASQERRAAFAKHQFQRRRYWIRSNDAGHPLLGSRLQNLAHLPATCVWESRLDTAAPLFEGHRVMGAAVLPWTAYAEMALAAASEAGEGGFPQVTDLALHRPVFLGEGGTHTLQSVLMRKSDEQFSFQVYDRTGTDKWLLCASATILIDHEDEQDELRADVFCQ
jgi:acyl transferase domain-containing protein